MIKHIKFKQIFLGFALVTSLSTSFATNMSEQSRDFTINTHSMNNSTMNDTSFKNLSGISRKQIRITLEEKLQNKLEDYQKLGLFNHVKNVQFRANVGVGTDQASFDSPFMELNFSKEASFNHLFLNTIAFTSEGSIEQQRTYDFEKTFLHELGHLQFAASPDLLPTSETNSKLNSLVNKLATSELKLSTSQDSVNDMLHFVHENVADVYAELAYMKLHDFSIDSIQSVKNDYALRQKETLANNQKYGEHFDSHNTTSSLKQLIQLLDTPDIIISLKSLPTENFDTLAKQIVYNSYQEYINTSSIKNNISHNIKNNLQDKELYENVLQLSFPKNIDVKKNIFSLREKLSKNKPTLQQHKL